MEEFLLMAAVVLFLLSLVLPVIAFVMVYTTRKRLTVVESDLAQRELELQYLYQRVKQIDAAPKAVAEKAATSEAETEQEAATRPADQPATPLEAETLPASALDDEDTAPVAPATEAETPEPSPDLPPEPIVPPKPAEPPPPKLSLEQRVASMFTRVGAGALLLGVLYFFKYAVDNEWIGPMGRVLIGAVAGVVILIASEIIRPRTRPAYVHAVVGVGLACLYISAYAASAFYQLIPTELAFATNAVILLLGAALAYRHRGEAVLVLVLVAGFLNPVLLSTGVDRPFALFAYLFAMTSVVLVVATHHGFRFAVPVAIVGVALLFSGWYERFFETFDHRGRYADRPPEELVGAYHALSARLIPLGAVLLFTVQWMATALRLRQLEKLPRFITPIAIASLVLGHVGMTALLFDQPMILGGVMILLGAGSVFVLRELKATKFLLIPMLAAFVLVLGLTEDTKDWNQLAVVTLLGVWTAVYVAAFLRELSPVFASIAIFAFVILAAAVMIPNERALPTAVAVTAGAAALAYVGFAGKKPLITLIATVFTLIPMLIAILMARLIPDPPLYWDPVTLAIGLLWAAALGAGPLLKEEVKAIDLFTLCLSGLGFLALALVGVDEAAPTLRALLTALVGVFFLGVASWPRRRAWSPILSALALGLFAPAVAFGLSGATITVVWAVLTGVAALILARARDQVWLITVALLAICTLSRVFFVDVPLAEAITRKFVYTEGRAGMLALPAFFNFRAYAFFGTGFAFIGGAFLLQRGARDHKPSLTISAILSVIAYAMLTIVLVVEVRAALLELPEPPPILLDRAEFDVFMQTVDDARAAQRNLLAMASTVVLAAIGTVLLSIGFAAKDAFHRYLGLIVLLGTIAKLVGWDVWNLARIYQVVALTVVGAVLLGSGFLYARLRGLFKGTVATLLLLTATTARAEPIETRPVETHPYSHLREIRGVSAAGDHRIIPDPDVFRLAKGRPMLADVRIADDRGHEVPYVFRESAALERPRFERVRMFDPGRPPDGHFRATFEIPEGLEHCHVRLELRGPAPYVRKTRIETGQATDDMQLVSEGALVWSLPDTTQSDVRYPRSIARYLRVTLLEDPNAERTRIAGASVGCDGPRAEPPYEEVTLQVTRIDRNADSKQTIVELDAGSEGVPLESIHLRVKTPEFMRRASLAASSYRSVWPHVSRGVLYRYRSTSEPSQLRLNAGGTRKRYLQVVIEDQDDAPLDVTGAVARTRVRELIFRTTRAGPHTLYLGAPEIRRPNYDLEDILARGESSPTTVKLGPPVANPTFGSPTVDAKLPVTERYRGLIGLLLGVALLALAVWAVRLIKKQES